MTNGQPALKTYIHVALYELDRQYLGIYKYADTYIHIITTDEKSYEFEEERGGF